MSAMKDIRLLGILLLALAVRTVMLFSVFAHVERAQTPDSQGYMELGEHLSLFHGYENGQGRFSDHMLMQMPEIFRTPGYPALLAAANWLADLPEKFAPQKPQQPTTGIYEYEGPPPPDYSAPISLRIILSFQVLLDLHLVLLTFFLGRSLAGHGAGLLAALLQAVSPLAAAASCRILSDSIFAFMLIAAVLLLLRHFRTGGWWPLVSAALIMGVACYIRPVGLAFSAVMALVIVCSRRGMGKTSTVGVDAGAVVCGGPPQRGEQGRSNHVFRPGISDTGGTTGEPEGPGTPLPRAEAPSFAEATEAKRPRRLLRMTAFAYIVAACIAPWVIRNIAVADYWGFSSFATDSMYWYSAAEIEARQQHKSVEEIRKQFHTVEGWDWMTSLGETTMPDFPDYKVEVFPPCLGTAGQLARYRWVRARGIILAHPWEFLDIHLRGDAAFWLPGAPDALEVLGYTSGGKGTLDVLHRQGLIVATKHYFGDNTIAIALAGAMVVILLVRYAGVVLCGLWRLRPRMSAAGWLCLLLVLTAWLLPGPANHPRFRVPVEPILSAAAAIGWLGLLEWRRRRATGET
jgi:hypothetical protein